MLIIKHIVKGLTSIVNIFGCKICLISIIDSGSKRATKKPVLCISMIHYYAREPDVLNAYSVMKV